MPDVISRDAPAIAPDRLRGTYLLTLRAIACVAWISLLTVVDSFFNRLTDENCDRRLKALGQLAVRLTRAAMSVEGLEHLEPGKTYLFMSNHESLIDIPFIFYAAPVPPRMVTKAELFRVPLWGAALRKAGFIAIKRQNRYQAIQSLQEAGKLMQLGHNIWIAPEGTRSRDGSLLPFKKGGFMMALDMGATIIPVGLVGARDIIRPKSFKAYYGQKAAVRFGKPIVASDYGVERRDELMADVRTAIDDLRRPI